MFFKRDNKYIEPTPIVSYTLDTIPEYFETMEKAYVIIDNNKPDFSDVIGIQDISKPFEIYSELYRVTPIFEEENLVTSGIHMEAMSINVSGDATNLKFNVYVYNVQKGATIDYSTGEATW